MKIYQIINDERNVKFMDYEHTVGQGGVDPADYQCVFFGDIDTASLDGVFNALNGFREDYLGTYQGHSLSTSDIVEVIGDIPEIYGKIEYLYAGEDHIAKVGETVYYHDSDRYYDDIHESQECGRPYRAENLSGQHLTLTEKGFHFCNSIGWQKIDFDSSQCKEMNGIRVLMILPGKTPIETRVIDDLEHWQRAVSLRGEDALMEVTYPFDDSAIIVSNEEAKLNGMSGNRRIGNSIYAGPMFVVNDDLHGNFCDLTDEQINTYQTKFEHPEDISPEEVQEDCGFTILPWMW